MKFQLFNRHVEILLVEDNPGDVRLTQEVLEETQVANNLHIAWDGVEALDFLKQTGEFADVPRPDLILLDLNLPKMDGRELLERIKSDDKLKHIPVLVLTTSEAEEDILKAYNLHANCYIVKPLDLDKFIEIIQAIENFWLKIAELPTEDL